MLGKLQLGYGYLNWQENEQYTAGDTNIAWTVSLLFASSRTERIFAKHRL